MKNTKSKIKPIKVGKQPETGYCLGWKDYTQNFRPQKVKMTNKNTQSKISVLFVNQISQGLWNKK